MGDQPKFDTLAFSHRLRAGGFTVEQADALTVAFRDLLDGRFSGQPDAARITSSFGLARSVR